MIKPKLGDLLLEANLIDEVQMRIALEEQKQRGTKFGSTLIALHFIDENVLTAFLSKQLDMPCVSLNNIEIAPRILSKVPREMAARLHCVPIRQEREKLFVAMADPMDMDAIEEVEVHTGQVVVPMVAPQSSLDDALKRHYLDEGIVREEAEVAVAGAFPELIREIEDLEIFGRQFRQLNDRLDGIEAQLVEIRRLVEGRAGS